MLHNHDMHTMTYSPTKTARTITMPFLLSWVDPLKVGGKLYNRDVVERAMSKNEISLQYMHHATLSVLTFLGACIVFQKERYE